MQTVMPLLVRRKVLKMRDWVLWNTGWWGMYGVWAFHDVAAKIAVAVVSFVVFAVIVAKWKAA